MTPDPEPAAPPIVQLGAGAEFDAIRQMLARWGPRAVGIGDDAAVIKLPRGDALVTSVDSFVEGRHFERGWITSRDLGYRAVSAALSDLAAMAARPLGILVALTVPESWRGNLMDLADGIADAVDVADTTIRGGNITGGTDLSITTTVLGSAFAPLTRTGARVGHGVYVTGQLGGPGAALRLLLAGESAGEHHHRFVHPVPRLGEGRWLAAAGASAAIDISDGLLADAGHLAAASGVRISIDARNVPRVHGADARLALTSGEEYELLLTAPTALDAGAFAARFGVPLTRIGSVVEGEPGTVHVQGARVAKASGYDHFSR
jgi:thiamine-monophosphate kinase